MDDESLQQLYVWVDSVPLSRPKRNIARDFSDGVMTAEIVHHYFPKAVELHNYSAANGVRQKLYNWATLNQRVFKRFGFEVKRADVEAIVACKPGVVEAVLMQLQQKMADYRAHRAADGSDAGASPGGNYDGAASLSRSGGDGGGGDAGTHGRTSRDALGAGGSISGGAPLGGRNADEPTLASYAGGGGAPAGGPRGVDASLSAAAAAERDAATAELRETVEILELKVRKLEQLVRLKDSRIQTLTARLQHASVGGAAQ